MRILVTGGAGYIGSHTAKLLAERGHEPVVIDNLSTGSREAVQWCPLIVGDVGDVELVRKILRDYQIEAVIHFAASIAVGESMENPRKYFRNNVVATLNLLEAMLAEDVRTLVYSSSCVVYGEPEYMPLDEQHPRAPINPYGETKLFIERALEWYGQLEGLRWMAMRYFNASGADFEGQIGEAHDPETHLIPLAIQAACGEIEQLNLFGTDYPTPDGTAVRDYVHVMDLAEAHLLAVKHLACGGQSAALNIGTGQGYSVREVIQAVEQIGERPVPVVEGPRRAGDAPELIANASRARQLLRWTPHHSDLATIVATAWRWHTRG